MGRKVRFLFMIGANFIAKQQNSGGAVKTVEALARPVVEGMGLRLWDVRFEKDGPDLFVRLLFLVLVWLYLEIWVVVL